MNPPFPFQRFLQKNCGFDRFDKRLLNPDLFVKGYSEKEGDIKMNALECIIRRHSYSEIGMFCGG